jgi:hypothetical protein
MEMGMKKQVLSQTMEYSEKADFGSRCLGSAAMVDKVSAVARKRMP